MSPTTPDPNDHTPLLSHSNDNIVTFSPNDPEDPRNWSSTRKWLMVAAIVPIDLSVSWGASAFSPVAGKYAADVGVSPLTATLGLSIYVLGLAFGPMTLAPLSEYFGRRPIYIISYALFLALLLSSTYTNTLPPFLILRFLSGYFSSTTISNFGGTIADLFPHHDTGPAMSLFLWAATGGSPTGFVLFSLLAPGHSWQAVLRILFWTCLAFWVLLVAALLLLGETRHSVILLHRTRALRARTGNASLSVPDDVKQRGVSHLFSTALTRPFRFLATEAIVQFSALYNGFLYGLSFLFNGAFLTIFGSGGYGFGTGGVGLCFLGIVAGITAGLATNVAQERHYQRAVRSAGGREVPEARVWLAKSAAVVLPVSLFIFALTAAPPISPALPIAASAAWGWSFYTLILMTLTYTEDAYNVFSASALAGIGLVRNVAGAVFPLLGHEVMRKVGTRNATLVLGGLAVVLAPIPFVLERRGAALRRRSPWAAAHEDEGAEED